MEKFKEYFDKFKAFCEAITAKFNMPWWVLPVGAFVLLYLIG
jgi:hypothetical protein